MTLPVSSYEELLVQVRGLTHETILLQRQLSSDLFDDTDNTDHNHNLTIAKKNYEKGKLFNDSCDIIRRQQENYRRFETDQRQLSSRSLVDRIGPARTIQTGGFQSTELTARLIAWQNQQNHESSTSYTGVRKSFNEDGSSEDEGEPSSCSGTRVLSSLHHGIWPVERGLWNGPQTSINDQQTSNSGTTHNDMSSVMSFSSSVGTGGVCPDGTGIQGQRRLGAKVDVVYSLLGMLGGAEGREDMSATLLSMSSSTDSCLAMRQSGCLPLLVQLIHAPGQDPETRERASQAIHNIVRSRGEERAGRREARVLRLLEQLRDYCQSLRRALEAGQPLDDFDRHPGPTIAALMKLSFDEAHRHAMCTLGGLHAVAELIEMDHAAHGSECDDPNCVTLRRYAGMALTNLTFGDGNNKALLSSFREFMKALVAQLRSPSDDLRQVTASVLRNLSWRADSSSKQTLREVGAVVGLTKAAMEGRKESTLKSILSALWNLSAHCSTNKIDICAVEGALAFLVDMLSYKAPSKTLAIVENAGGILRNVSSHVAVREDYRSILRERGCLQVLLRQLRSPSLTVVSNACGALWNLSARCPQDQRVLWDLGAVPMLRSLVHSKHKMISLGSSAALKNLLGARPGSSNLVHLDSTARGLGLPTLPTLAARRQRALEQEIDQNLAETCDNIEPSTSPTNKDDKFAFKLDRRFTEVDSRQSHSLQPPRFSRSESRESVRSVTSTHSDTIFERVNRHVLNGVSPTEAQSASLHAATAGTGNGNKVGRCDRKYVLRYKNAVPERQKDTGFVDARCVASTMSWASGADHDSQILLRSSIESSSLIDELNRSTASNEGDVKSQYSSEEIDSGLGNGVSRNSTPMRNGSSRRRQTDSGDFTFGEGNGDRGSLRLRYSAHDSDEEERKHSGYFVEAEDVDAKAEARDWTYEAGTSCERRVTSERSDREKASQSAGSSCLPRPRVAYKRVEPSDERKLVAKGDICTVPDDEINDREENSDLEQKTVNDDCTLVAAFDLSADSVSETLVECGSSLAYEPEEQNLSLPVQRSSESVLQSANREMSINGVLSANSTLDDELKIARDSSRKEYTDERSFDSISRMKEPATSEVVADCDIIIETAEENEGDEEVLAARAEIHAQNDRHRQSIRRASLDNPQPVSNLTRYQTSCALNQVDTTAVLSSSSDISDGIVDICDEVDVQHEIDAPITDSVSQNQEIRISDTEVLSPALEIDSTEQELNIATGDEERETVIAEELKESSLVVVRDTSSRTVFDFSGTIKNFEEDRIDSKIVSGETETDSKNTSEDDNLSDEPVSPAIDPLLAVVERANRKEDRSKNRDENDEEYRRQRDPDAMIASLDRLTATLVQQTEAMRERESCAMKQSVISDTWNEDSPNDVSFPSMSVSAPLVASFKSDNQEEVMDCRYSIEEQISSHANMTQSTFIEREANKLAEAVNAFDTMSLTSLDHIDSVRPPSTMGSLVSLTTSLVGPNDLLAGNDLTSSRERCHSASLPPFQIRSQSLVGESRSPRKKSIPCGVVAKRALNQYPSHTGSLENLLNDCGVSHLENVKPPSMMDELLDAADMENSMLSVASITSEVADSKEQDSHSLTGSDPVFDLLKPVANILSMTCMRYVESMQLSGNNSLSECLENINPPSLFNEVSEMDDTTMEPGTETLCSDTLLCMENELRTEQDPVLCASLDLVGNDTDEATTPIPSEYSSAESTPKKRHKNHLTPKQKRQLAKERYKTYTIAAEMVKKEEEERRKQEQESRAIPTLTNGKCKLTPKQRRREDRARFQTQVLNEPLTMTLDQDSSPRFGTGQPEPLMEAFESPEAAECTSVKSGIPTFRKSPRSKTLKQKRVENQDRYRTRTLNDEDGNSAGELDESIDQSDPESNHEDQSIRRPSTNGIPRLAKPTNSTQQYSLSRTPFVKLAKRDPMEAVQMEEERGAGSDSESEEEGSTGGAVEEQPQIPRRPRIVKPGAVSRDGSVDSNGTDKSEPGSPKAIRGRRRALYSNPSGQRTVVQSVAKVSSGIPVGRGASAPSVRGTRATALRQSHGPKSPQKVVNHSRIPSSAEKRSRQSAMTPSSNRGALASQRVGSTKSPPARPIKEQSVPVKPLERQGTFTKEEPEMENVPQVCCDSPTRSKIGRVSKTSPSKIQAPSVKGLPTPKVNVTQRKYAKSSSLESTSPPAHQRRSLVGSPIKNSPSNQSLQGGSTDPKTPKKQAMLGQRSNSNSSIVSNSSGGAQPRRAAKEATSKIASLWKRVEESKTKQRFEKNDTRQWITPSETDGSVVTSKPPTFRLIRSSTFEGMPKEGELSKPKSTIVGKRQSRVADVNGVVPKYRNSCDLSGMSAAEAPCKIPVKFSSRKEGGTQVVETTTVVLRKQGNAEAGESEVDPTKRVSRLGSFIRVDGSTQSRVPASAVVSPFNYNPKQTSPTQAIRPSISEMDGKIEVTECQVGITTSSHRVTTV